MSPRYARLTNDAQRRRLGYLKTSYTLGRFFMLNHLEKIMDIKKLNSLISNIGKKSAALRDDIQAALIGCAEQAQLHRNTTPFNELFKAVGTGTRLEGMLKWASLYAPVHFKDGKVMLSDKRQKEYDGTAEELAALLAQSEKWYAIAKPEPIANPWDSKKFAESLALYLENAAKKADKEDHELAKLIQTAEMVFRAHLNRDYEVVEVAE